MDFQEQFNKAWEYKKEGKYKDALKLYSNLYDMLVAESNEYARKFEGAIIDTGTTRKIMPLFIAKAKNYLKRDNTACTILNNMGVIFAELGEFDTAKKYFKESIMFTPDNLDYPNPKIALKSLDNISKGNG